MEKEKTYVRKCKVGGRCSLYVIKDRHVIFAEESVLPIFDCCVESRLAGEKNHPNLCKISGVVGQGESQCCFLCWVKPFDGKRVWKLWWLLNFGEGLDRESSVEDICVDFSVNSSIGFRVR